LSDNDGLQMGWDITTMLRDQSRRI
jgi:hypothetical protein